MQTKTDPWNGGLFDTTSAAQKAFDQSPDFDDKQCEWSQEYHNNCATAADRARVEALTGDQEQIVAWYWDDAYRAGAEIN